MNEKIENCVYQITVNNKQYIGSCKNFNKRISSHKTSSKYLPYQLYEEIDGDWDNSNIIVLEKNIDYSILKIVEQYYIDKIKPELNTIRAYITDEQREEYYKQYYQDHKHIMMEYNQQVVKCNCGCSISRHHLARHKRSKKHLKLLENINITI